MAGASASSTPLLMPSQQVCQSRKDKRHSSFCCDPRRATGRRSCGSVTRAEPPLDRPFLGSRPRCSWPSPERKTRRRDGPESMRSRAAYEKTQKKVRPSEGKDSCLEWGCSRQNSDTKCRKREFLKLLCTSKTFQLPQSRIL